MEKVDIFIPCVYKDFNKLNFLLPSIVKYIKEAGDIYVSMPDIMNLKDFEIDGHQIKFSCDREIVDPNLLKRARFRPNWLYQQLLKLLQRKTQTTYSFIVDADLVFVNDFELFENGKPIQYFGPPQNRAFYYNFMRLISRGELGREYDVSFIADCGLFKNSTIDEMLAKYGFTKESFSNYVLSYCFFTGVDENSILLSEYELFGNYNYKFHKDEYIRKQLRITTFDHLQRSQQEQIYSNDFIAKSIQEVDKTKYNVMKFQSGCLNVDIAYNGMTQS